MKVSESVNQFLHTRQTDANTDLIGLFHTGMEFQVNVSQGDGELVAGKRHIYSNGVETWGNIRQPKKAATSPVDNDYEMSWILDDHAEAIGMTGFDWCKRSSVFVGYDIDAKDHAEGLTDKELQAVNSAADRLPYVERRKSTGGKGTHLYIYVNVPTANHTEHAHLAKIVLAKMSKDAGFDFAPYVDAFGGIMWCWHATKTEGLAVVKKSEATLTETDLPTDWQIKPEKSTPVKVVPTNSAIEDYKLHGDWQVLRELGCEVNDKTFLRPGSDKEKSGDFGVSKDGTPLVRLYTSGLPPLEKDKSYNQFTVLQYLKHGGSYKAALADIREQGFGVERFSFTPLKEWIENRKETDWLVDKLWVAGQPGLIAGEEKTLKTFTALELAIALQSGEPFLGQFDIKRKCNVAMMSGESGLDTLTETAARICKAKGVAYPDVWLTEMLPHFNNPVDISRFKRAFRERKTDVLIVDPLGYTVPGVNVANQFDVYAAMDPIIKLTRECGVSLILVCHTRKRAKGDDAYGTKGLADIAYAGWAALARQWIILHRQGAYQGDGLHKLWLDYGGSAGQSARWGYIVNEGSDCDHRKAEVRILSCIEATAKNKEGTVRERILAVLDEYPNGETKTCIFDTAKPRIHSDGSTRNIFDTLVAEGIVVPCTIKKNGKDITAWKRAPDPVQGATGTVDVGAMTVETVITDDDFYCPDYENYGQS